MRRTPGPGKPPTGTDEVRRLRGQADDDASYPDFQRTAAELDTRIGFLLAALAAPDNIVTTSEEES